MAWQNFQYGTLHVGRDDSTGTFSIVDSGGVASAVVAGDLNSLADSRAGSLVTWDDTEYLRLDRSASPGSTPDALFIPKGHNLTDVTVYKRSTATGATTSVGTAAGLTSSDPIWITLSSIDRYLDIAPTTSGGVDAYVGEVVYTDLTTPTIGPEAGWRDRLELVTQRSVLESGGSAVLQKGTSQRVLELTYPHVTAAADVTIFTAVEATGGSPFVLLPAYDDEDVRWVYLDGDPERFEQSTNTGRQSIPAGQTTLVPGYRFRLREQTL